MTRPNLKPSARDDARILERIENAERRYNPRGPRTFADLDDVDAIHPNDGDVATYVATTGKIEMQPPASGGSGFPVTKDDGFATTKIDTAHTSGGGADQTTFTESILDETGSPKPRWDVLASVADGPASGGGAQFLTQYLVRASSISGNNNASLVLLSTSGADADGVRAELLLEPTTFLGFDTVPHPHVILEAGADPSGSPAFGRIRLESAAFGPIDVFLGGDQNDRVFMPNLPTSDPGNPDQVWNDSGTLKISP